MRKTVKRNERFVGLKKLANRTGLNRNTLHYWAVKARTRTWKMNGVRVIEVEDAICLVRFLENRFTNADFSEILNELHQKVTNRTIV